MLSTFKATLMLDNVEQRTWLEEQLARDEDGVYRYLLDHPDCETVSNFSHVFVSKPDGSDLYMSVYADDGQTGRPDVVVELVATFLRKFRPDGYWTMSWSTYHEGGYCGGGAAFVTAEKVEFMTTANFIATQTEHFQIDRRIVE